MTITVVAMFLATMGMSNVQAASPVKLEADQTPIDIMENGVVNIMIDISSTDSRYKKMDVFLKANWPGGTEWPTY